MEDSMMASGSTTECREEVSSLGRTVAHMMENMLLIRSMDTGSSGGLMVVLMMGNGRMESGMEWVSSWMRTSIAQKVSGETDNLPNEGLHVEVAQPQ